MVWERHLTQHGATSRHSPRRPGRAVPGSRTGLRGSLGSPRSRWALLCAHRWKSYPVNTWGPIPGKNEASAFPRQRACCRQETDPGRFSHFRRTRLWGFGQAQQANSGRRSQAEGRFDQNSPCSSQNQDQKSREEIPTEKMSPSLDRQQRARGSSPLHSPPD